MLPMLKLYLCWLWGPRAGTDVDAAGCMSPSGDRPPVDRGTAPTRTNTWNNGKEVYIASAAYATSCLPLHCGAMLCADQ